MRGPSPQGAAVADLLRAAAALAAPPRCGVCAGPCEWRRPACVRCLAALDREAPARRLLPGLGAVVGAAPYRGVARDLVAALKFGPRPGLAGVAASAIADALHGLDPPGPGAAVVAVPAAPARARRRGFDPAGAIAGALAAELGLPLAGCLRRDSARRHLGRSRGERLATPPRVRVDGAAPDRAILVDDVLTTGATLAACARALRSGGSTEVGAAVLALALPGGGLRGVERGGPTA